MVRSALRFAEPIHKNDPNEPLLGTMNWVWICESDSLEPSSSSTHPFRAAATSPHADAALLSAAAAVGSASPAWVLHLHRLPRPHRHIRVLGELQPRHVAPRPQVSSTNAQAAGPLVLISLWATPFPRTCYCPAAGHMRMLRLLAQLASMWIDPTNHWSAGS